MRVIRLRSEFDPTETKLDTGTIPGFRATIQTLEMRSD
jgi:hypothetical protein